jgi:aminopeptidase YwaD
LLIFVAVRKLGIMIQKTVGVFKALAIVLIATASLSAVAQTSGLKATLKEDISVLASEQLEGRMTGEEGERLAADYIAGRFKDIGLSPVKGKSDFFSDFEFDALPVLGNDNSLNNGAQLLALEKDFYPLSYSASGKAKGMVLNIGFGINDAELQRNDYPEKIEPGHIFLMDISSPDGIHPHSKFLKHHDVIARIEGAMKYAPSAFILYTNDPNAEIPSSEMRRSGKKVQVPVIFVKSADKVSSSLRASLSVDIIRESKTGRNVLGYLNNRANKTIVLGAHYDHLGFGDEHGSLHRGIRQIHYGADDNASGVAAILALAQWAKTEGPKNHNYIFVAFSGEELGLIGSGALVKDAVIDLSSVNYMLNFDMVGRLDSLKNTLIVSGSGTSPQWTFLDSARYDFIKLKLSESGIGPSDHTSFYLKNIPVLAFFSGTHPDYHKPSDLEIHINYSGMVKIIDVAKDIIKETAALPKLEFSKTKDDTGGNVPRFKVTLGVVPDYAYSGAGLRIDGVTEGKPAAAAGLQAGDIVTKLGDLPVNDMTSYMKALGYFAKGDRTEVVFKRGGEVFTKTIQF